MYNLWDTQGTELKQGLDIVWDLSADESDADAQFRIGERFEAGRGIPQDYERAAEWFRKAAEQGHPETQNKLG